MAAPGVAAGRSWRRRETLPIQMALAPPDALGRGWAAPDEAPRTDAALRAASDSSVAAQIIGRSGDDAWASTAAPPSYAHRTGW